MRSAAAPLRRQLALSAQCTGRHLRSVFSAGGRQRVVVSFRAVSIDPHSRHRCTRRRRSCAPRVRRVAASDAAALRSAAAPLQRRLALSARCASSPVAFCTPCSLGNRRTLEGPRRHAALTASLHVTPLVRSSRLPCRCMRCGGVAYGGRSAAAAALAPYAVRVVVLGSARSLRAAQIDYVTRNQVQNA